MKRIITSLALMLAFATVATAQKYCTIDSKYILDKLNDYKDAQIKLDNVSKVWQKEIDDRMAEVDRMYKAYQAERPMLTDDMRKKREDEIVSKEKDAKDLQKTKVWLRRRPL